jgi:hypothetical protein
MSFVRRKFAFLSLRRHSTGSLFKAGQHEVDDEQVSVFGQKKILTRFF